MTQEQAYDYIESLVAEAKPLIDIIEEQWDLLTIQEVDNICYDLRKITEDAVSCYESLEADNLDIVKMVHHLEYALQDAEELFKEKEAQQ